MGQSQVGYCYKPHLYNCQRVQIVGAYDSNHAGPICLQLDVWNPERVHFDHDKRYGTGQKLTTVWSLRQFRLWYRYFCEQPTRVPDSFRQWGGWRRAENTR